MKLYLRYFLGAVLVVFLLMVGGAVGALLEQQIGGWWWKFVGIGFGVLAINGLLNWLPIFKEQ